MTEVSGKLSVEDYHRFAPLLERCVAQHGKISILFNMNNFDGWEVRALWEDLKFDAKHYADIDRLAMVGDKTWEKWMADFCRPFTRAALRFFDPEDIDDARRWLEHEKTSGGKGRPLQLNPATMTG